MSIKSLRKRKKKVSWRLIPWWLRLSVSYLRKRFKTNRWPCELRAIFIRREVNARPTKCERQAHVALCWTNNPQEESQQSKHRKRRMKVYSVGQQKKSKRLWASTDWCVKGIYRVLVRVRKRFCFFSFQITLKFSELTKTAKKVLSKIFS